MLECIVKAVLLSVAMMMSVLSGCSNGNGRESPGDKKEWSILQGQEIQHRAQIPRAPEVSTVDGYTLVSVSSADSSQRIWIMLWPKSPPFYKQMPQGDFEIPQALLLEWLGQKKISSTVYEALRSHVRTADSHS
jgi:hypothetical protein